LDYVVTVCNNANETCPIFRRSRIIHFGFDDPPHLAKNLDDPEMVLGVYRKVRDQIAKFVEDIDTYIAK